jgi:hypothetical protein
MYSITGIKNILTKEPVEILKGRLSRANIIIAQKITEFSEMYNNCLASDDFTYADTKTNLEYRLILDLMMVKEKGEF